MVQDLPNDDTGQALRRIASDGSDLTRPIEMDFFVAVPSSAAGEDVAQVAQSLGYRTSVEQDVETKEWTCYCTKTLIPDYSTVCAIERELDSLAASHGGYADGFGTYGNAEIESDEPRETDKRANGS